MRSNRCGTSVDIVGWSQSDQRLFTSGGDMLKLAIYALAAAGLMPLSLGLRAQDFPAKPVILTIPFAAGGPTDTLGRNLALAMSTPLKQQVIVENVVGAGGTIAYAKIAKSKPDGYSVLLAH